MPYRSWITVFFPTPLIFRYHLPLRSPGTDSQPGGPVRHPYLSHRPARLHRLAESIPGLLKRLQIRAQPNYHCGRRCRQSHLRMHQLFLPLDSAINHFEIEKDHKRNKRYNGKLLYFSNPNIYHIPQSIFCPFHPSTKISAQFVEDYLRLKCVAYRVY